MSKIISDVVVVPVFSLSAVHSEAVAAGAEMVADSALDFRKGSDLVGGVLGSLQRAGELSFIAFEAVRSQFVAVAEVRARDNGAADPKGAADDYWGRVMKFVKEFHGITKPKSDNPESAAKQAKREAEKAKLLAVAGERSAAELKAEIKTHYGEASDESIAKAKALEKALKVVQAVENDSVSEQMKPLLSAAADGHKAIMEFMKAKNDPKILGDYVVLLKRTLDIWKTGSGK